MATGTKSRTKTIRPLEDRIVVKPFDPEEKTPGGIVLPDTAKEKPQQGEVIAAGVGKLLESGERAEMLVKVGDTVLYGKYSGTEVELDGETYVILRESDVLGILDK